MRRIGETAQMAKDRIDVAGPAFAGRTLTGASDPYAASVTLLTSGSSDPITDDKGNTLTVRGPFITIPSTTGLQFGTGDFTVEAWVYLTATPGAQNAHVIGRTEYGSNGDWMLWITNTRALTMYINNGFKLTTTALVPLNQWCFISASRVSGTLYLSIDGTTQSASSITESTENSGSGVYTIGADQLGDEAVFTGGIGQIRVTKGVGRYTGNYEKPRTRNFPRY